MLGGPLTVTITTAADGRCALAKGGRCLSRRCMHQDLKSAPTQALLMLQRWIKHRLMNTVKQQHSLCLCLQHTPRDPGCSGAK